MVSFLIKRERISGDNLSESASTIARISERDKQGSFVSRVKSLLRVASS